MTDINEQVRRPGAKTVSVPSAMDNAAGNEPERDPALLDLVELLFFAYRDFTREPDKILEEIGFGRAHHRVLHFVNRHSGLRVADLLEILKITKQSLGRVLKQLVDEGYIIQQAGKTDRRERLLYSTARGQELASQLALPQLTRIAHALEASGAESHICIEKFLGEMINEADRTQVSRLLNAGAGPRGGSGEPA